METYNPQAIIDVKQGLDAVRHGGIANLINQFFWAAKAKIDRGNIDIKGKAILDVEQSMDILNSVGSEGFAVFFLLESTERRLSINDISEQLRLPLDVTRSATQRLGMYMLGIDDIPKKTR